MEGLKMNRITKLALLALTVACCSAWAQEQAAPDAPAAKSKPASSKQAKTSAAAPHKTTAADRQAVEVTIYNRNLGLVKEQRKISIPAGQGELQFMDVANQINPVTVHIKPLANAADFAVLEQNYEYDLISHAKLMEKYVGKDIQIIDRNEYQDRHRVVNAKLLSMNGGEVYEIEDKIYLGHPGIKVLPTIPGNLISRPTLSWIFRNRTAREYQLEVSYLTGGMNWNADYVLLVGADAKAPSGLSGWVTVNNQSGGEYENAKLKLVAGEVNRVRQDHGRGVRPMAARGMAMEMAAPAPEFAQSEMFEYYLYDLQRPTTLKQNQTKQISLMEAQGLAVDREYVTTPNVHLLSRFEGTSKQAVVSFFTFKNSKDNKLGDPLPAGIIRIYTADVNGSQQFIGEDRIAHTPRDEEIRLRVGEAFDIVAERTQLNFTQRTNKQTETEWQVAIRNRKNEDITVRVQENARGQWQVRDASHKHTKVDANTFRFDVPVAKGQEVIVKYKLRVDM